MRRVQFVNTAGTAWPWDRQFPSPNGVWKGTQYAFDELKEGQPDWLVVYDGWPAGSEFHTSVPLQRRILVCAEPESFHRYQSHFLRQFGHVITSQSRVKHPGVIRSQVGINWFAGVRFNGVAGPHTAVLRFQDFEVSNPPKTKLCSVVCSTKAVTAGHRARLAFVRQLQAELGDQVDVYGRGFREIADKDEALADYRFHIALENSVQQDYWTEKLADAYLRGCFPIYVGCPNLDAYFPHASYDRIDISHPRRAIARIKEILASDMDHHQAAELAEAKRRVLWEHNIFALLEHVYTQLESSPQKGVLAPLESPVPLLSDHQAKDFKLSRRIKRMLWNLFGKTGR
ncbi:glycosyltransferase family 10 domain-containing protein [Rhodoferax mekongensis]|uniref:Glycosyltransferase family 10 n=1 Tax=Rhodoferax mekongensis TaxID=3068341 RepID=A0ABZ0AYA5_9BURK|nr:glycosyltransferase family 10 [Rhodoferax sp. TBRC 17307]WNO03724.1 glycosyltransferase family 10 [Rhodoferax sp. TBRC 17307]